MRQRCARMSEAQSVCAKAREATWQVIAAPGEQHVGDVLLLGVCDLALGREVEGVPAP